jgi:hypothetical protein
VDMIRVVVDMKETSDKLDNVLEDVTGHGGDRCFASLEPMANGRKGKNIPTLPQQSGSLKLGKK